MLRIAKNPKIVIPNDKKKYRNGKDFLLNAIISNAENIKSITPKV
jgi:hypothetical protein